MASDENLGPDPPTGSLIQTIKICHFFDDNLLNAGWWETHCAIYLKFGLGLDWAGHVRARELSELPTICSMATEENLGTELPMGSNGKEG